MTENEPFTAPDHLAPPAPSAVALAPAVPTEETKTVVEQKDNIREIVETIVFVAILVLLLKSFVAEAFVIPTGSMAETLWGYQKVVACPRCGWKFPVNCANEVEPAQQGDRGPVTSCTCPNCREHIGGLDKVPWTTGDRVLVAKFLYDLNIAEPNRHDVVVFKFPKEPQRNHVAMNYIKRLVGLPGETIGIWYGDLYVTKELTHPALAEPDTRELHRDDPRALEMLREGKGFDIVRKDPDEMLAMRRIVYDNDRQYENQKQRWTGNQWTTADNRSFAHKGDEGKNIDWLRYQNFINGSNEPELITDLLGYNTGNKANAHGHNWVGDLMIDCEINVQQAKGEFILELNKSENRFQAVFDLANGNCKLVRIINDKAEDLETKPTSLKQPGTYKIRFANFDQRLTVWVDKELPFGAGVAYASTKERGPTEDDLKPAAIGVRDADLTVQHVQLWRDTYYTSGHQPDSSDAANIDEATIWKDRMQWGKLRQLEPRTMYVQPGHYLCMGDNSQQSSDAREWGLVPRRLMLGRALYVYYPFHFPYWPLYTPVGRTGPIR